MYLNPLFLTSLGLLAPALSAPADARIKISITEQVSTPNFHVGSDHSQPLCMRAYFSEKVDCTKLAGPGWYYKDHTCCIDYDTEDVQDSTRHAAAKDQGVSKKEEVCLKSFLKKGTHCAAEFGEDWYFKPTRGTSGYGSCCRNFSGEGDADEESLVAANSDTAKWMPAAGSTVRGKCVAVPVGVDCPSNIAPYGELCCEPDDLYSPGSMPTGFNTRVKAIAEESTMPTGFETRIKSSMKTTDTSMPSGFESNPASTSVEPEEGDMPTGFGTTSPVDPAGKGGAMPTGFEVEGEVQEPLIVHTEML